MAFLLANRRPIAAILLALLLSHCCYQAGDNHRDAIWQAKWQAHAAEDAKALADYQAKARKQEADWSAAFDAAATIQHEEMTNVTAHRDRLLAALRAGSLRLPSAPAAVLPQAPAHPGEPQGGSQGGQPGMVGEAITGRLATCDEVTLERNQAVRLLEAERAGQRP